MSRKRNSEKQEREVEEERRVVGIGGRKGGLGVKREVLTRCGLERRDILENSEKRLGVGELDSG